MSRELFRVPLGIEIQSEDLLTGVNLLQGTGAPGTRVIEQDAPIGTFYFQSDAAANELNTWWKFRDLNNDVTDWHVGASKDYVDDLVLGGVSTGSAPALTTTSLDGDIPVSVATEIKWMLQIKDSTTNRQAFEIHALTDGTDVSYTTYALLKRGNIGGNIGFDVTLAGSPATWDITLTPNAGAGTLTYTLKRISFSFLA